MRSASGRTPSVRRLPAWARRRSVNSVGTRTRKPLGLQPQRVAVAADRDIDEVHRRRADEAGDELVGRLAVELERLADLLHAAVLHHHHAVAEGHRLDLVVGDVDRGGLELLVQALELDAHLHAQLGVQVGQRLVEQEHLRMAHDRAPDRDALALAAGELPRLALEQRLDAEDVGGFAHPLVDVVLRIAAHLQAEGHVVEHGLVRVERVVLEHHGDVAVLRRQVVHHLLADADLARGDLLQAGHHPQRRRLAAARRPDQHEELLVADFEVDVLDGVKAVVVVLVQVADRDVGHFCLLSSL